MRISSPVRCAIALMAWVIAAGSVRAQAFVGLGKQSRFVQTGPTTVTADLQRAFEFSASFENLSQSATNPAPPNSFTLPNNGGTRTLSFDSNNDWNANLASVFTAVGAFSLARGSKDAALQRSISGPHSAQIKGPGAGVVLVEVYDSGGAGKLVNVSARNFVGTGDNVLICGFVVDGTAAKTLLIRGVGAFDLTPGSRDATLVVTLPPGSYTAQISGVGGMTGEALAEVYELP